MKYENNGHELNTLSVKVRAPSSIANIGPGFDIFALAIDLCYDEVEVSINKYSNNIKLKVFGYKVPENPNENTAGIVAKEFLERFNIKSGLNINILKGIKPGLGLGSSAATASATALALSRLFNIDLSVEDMVLLASKGEIASAGTSHLDNVSAALLGGFTITCFDSNGNVKVFNIPPPSDLRVVIAIPHVDIRPMKTSYARNVIPKHVELSKLILNTSRIAGIIIGILKGDSDLLSSFICDEIVEPARSKIYTYYPYIRSALNKLGVKGVMICGAGPSIAAIPPKSMNIDNIIETIKSEFRSLGLNTDVYVAKPANGCKVIS
ncbi:MAG: homoserine kinase [Candidatus Methanomethylicia archaeon]